MSDPVAEYRKTWNREGWPIREQIMSELLERARLLVPTATRDPQRIPVEALPRLIVQDQTETGRESVYRKHQMALRVVCEYSEQVIANDCELSRSGNVLLANLLQTLLSPDITLGGLCSEVRYETSTIDYPDGGDSIIRVTVGLTINYGFALGNPFSLT